MPAGRLATVAVEATFADSHSAWISSPVSSTEVLYGGSTVKP